MKFFLVDLFCSETLEHRGARYKLVREPQLPRSPEEAAPMSDPLPVIYVARRGETAESFGPGRRSADLPRRRGEGSRRAGFEERLKGLSLANPPAALYGARREPARWPASALRAGIDRDLFEWNLRRASTRPWRGRASSPRTGWRLLPRWLPRRRIARSNWRAGRPGSQPLARHSRRRAAVFQRPFPARARRSLARARTGGR